MRVYLDACCLNRPFDDQSQERIRLEAEAVTLFVQLVRAGSHEWVSSEVVEDELSRMPDEERKVSVTALLKYSNQRLTADDEAFELAAKYATQGVAAMDALHLAVANVAGCDILLTTDDAFARRAERVNPRPRVRVVNPAKWMTEVLEP